MSCVFIFFLYTTVITLVDAVPTTTVLAAKNIPSCFPTRPYCIRPRVDECYDAIFLVTQADPGYPIILGRPEVVGDSPRSFGVPRSWASLPPNCILKLDVTDPRASEELRLKSLTVPAEVVVKKCIIGGTGCGGSILVGQSQVLELTLAYYTAVDPNSGFLEVSMNGSILTHISS